MSTATALSRITGFVRMWATGFALALTPLASPYFVANNIPNMVYELVAGGILSALFIPTFMELRAERGEEASWRFASHVFNLAVLSLGLVAVVGTLWPEPFIWTQTFRAHSADAIQARASAEFFFRFFAIQVVIYGGGMVVQGLLNAQRKYLWAALGPVVNNVVVIVTMFVFAAIARTDPDRALIVLAAGTTLGVLAMFAVMVPDLVRGGIRYSAELGLGDPAVRRMLRLAIPTVLYVGTNMVAVSFRNASALAVTPKGPAALMYAWTFYQLPYGIIAVALATAVFTELADSAGRKDLVALKAHFSRGLRVTGLLMLPAAAILIALSEPLISLYRVGEFRASDVPMVAGVLRLWACGLIFFACMMFVDRKSTRLKLQSPAMISYAVFCLKKIGLYLVLSTGVAGWAGLGVNGIPIADGVFYLLMFTTLGLLLRRRIGGYDIRGVSATFGLMLLASTVGGVATWGTARLLAPATPGFGAALLQVVSGGSAGLLVSFGGAALLRVPEVSFVIGLVRRSADRGKHTTDKGA